MNFTDCADLMLTDLKDSYYVQVLTETGKKIIAFAKKLFGKPSSKNKETVKNLLINREQDFPDPIKDFEKIPPQLEDCYEGEMWQRYGKRCFGCGSCTMVCPTCFCFDVKDHVDLSLTQGVRVRNWDSCQLIDFALVAGGHNFRPTIASRVRFRIYHKFRTEPEQINKIGCVGCGRCTRACPADIDMIELLSDIQKGGN
jgi:sulfhydrogenase subunit beta (sulfur reductase)